MDRPFSTCEKVYHFLTHPSRLTCILCGKPSVLRTLLDDSLPPRLPNKPDFLGTGSTVPNPVKNRVPGSGSEAKSY